jgi:ABC-type cobalamin/Fe3+-siderophores transport system ATPase subunit
MPFNLTIPRSTGAPLCVTVGEGDILFVLGANGTGKSSLMQQFFIVNHSNAHRISAHRQTWFHSHAGSLSPLQKRQTEQYIRSQDINRTARWLDAYPAERANVAIYDLIEAENERARQITAAVDGRNIGLAEELSKKDAPLKLINELLRLSNIPIEISIRENQEVVARKSGSEAYGVAELSDGERNALLIAADVLTAKAGTLLLIDEPERHLHRSIISPLLTLLFAKRRDCAFVVSTHELMLPLDNPEASTLLVRSCNYANSSVTAWDADLLQRHAPIDDDLKKDVLGARRKILFVEGTDQSLDKPLYSLVFPGVSIVSKESCRDVEHAVSGLREADDLHWVRAFGIVDNDRRTPGDIDRLKAKGVYAVSVFSVESIYYHPEIQRRVAERHAGVTGGDALTRLTNAKAAAIDAVVPHVPRLSERVAEKALREEVLRRLPRRQEIASGQPINISIDVASVVSAERGRLLEAIGAGDVSAIIAQYPIRETPALARIANELGFKSREQYQGAVRKLLMDDAAALSFVRALFGTLGADIDTV